MIRQTNRWGRMTADYRQRHFGLGVRLCAAACFLVSGAIAKNNDPLLLPRSDVREDATQNTDLQKKLEIYLSARRAFDEQTKSYWASVADKGTKRLAKLRQKQELVAVDYELEQPPVYSGPPNPLPALEEEKKNEASRYIPVVADFLEAAEDQFRFKPDRPESEERFKIAYVKAAAAAGLTKNQVVRIYSFETGGNGTYDMQAGLEETSAQPGHAISTAIGYNQLLHVNTIELLAEKGNKLVASLKKISEQGSIVDRSRIKKKQIVLLQMIRFARSVPDEWAEHQKIANTRAGLGVHALNLDMDIGPWLQVENLVTSIHFANGRGITRTLSAAELEMMNLTGDETGLDVIAMPLSLRGKVPTSNFFQPAGYERNPVAIRNNTVEALLTAMDRRMDRASEAQGARDLANFFETSSLR